RDAPWTRAPRPARRALGTRMPLRTRRTRRGTTKFCAWMIGAPARSDRETLGRRAAALAQCTTLGRLRSHTIFPATPHDRFATTPHSRAATRTALDERAPCAPPLGPRHATRGSRTRSERCVRTGGRLSRAQVGTTAGGVPGLYRRLDLLGTLGPRGRTRARLAHPTRSIQREVLRDLRRR